MGSVQAKATTAAARASHAPHVRWNDTSSPDRVPRSRDDPVRPATLGTREDQRGDDDRHGAEGHRRSTTR